MSNFSSRHVKLTFIFLCIGMLCACNVRKDSASGKGIQNLTARFNYIYNANIILDDYVSALHTSPANNYNELLTVHLSAQQPNSSDLPTSKPDKVLDEIINKARTIITDKSLSNYLDDAYLLMGKSQFYKGNYFLSAEYFEYVANTYKDNPQTYIHALDWKARSLMQLGDFKSAARELDSLEKYVVSTKKNLAEPYATLAGMALYLKQPGEAITYLQAALKESKDIRNTIRWHFLLGQLYEQQQAYEYAKSHYKKVQSSNTGFELYFNAKLKLIRLNALVKGDNINREQQLLGLLKDDKNLEFSDQIYFQIAEYFQEQQDYTKAQQYYDKSIAAESNNRYLKGLAYLELADLNATQIRDYLQAKNYYDSTLVNLPKHYHGYELILKKSQNLDYLATRYAIIAEQDTLQALAKLPEIERVLRARYILFPRTTDSIPLTPANLNTQVKTGTFYFNNQLAMESGYADFIKRWGNRILEDNWRQSIRNNAPNTQQTLSLDPITLQRNGANDPQTYRDSITLTNFLASIPVNQQMLQASNEKIVNAYFELASFYQQELKDTGAAARIYESLVTNYPDNNQLAAINYSLFLIYRGSDEVKANTHKEQLLTNHASSIYARAILEPNFTLNQNTQELENSNTYNNLFTLYQQKDFGKVIQIASQNLQENPGSKLAAQFAYLKAIAVGRTAHVDRLLNELQNIKHHYPNDQLIVPLVNDHLTYINTHMADFKKRQIALIDFDPNEPRFIAQQVAVQQALSRNQPGNPTSQNAVTQLKPVELQARPANFGPFSKAASSTWYFVIDVEDATIRLSSSRFGIGQFSRGNYPESNLKHQLVEFDNDQLIYVGNFSSFEAVKDFQDRITPQLSRIMRVRPSIYKAFIISKENFDIIKSKPLLNQYQEFYKNNY